MEVTELWTAEDDVSLKTFVEAIEIRDLCGALLAIEGVSVSAANVCRQQLSIWSDWVAAELRTGSLGDPARALGHVLGDQLDFRGDEADYHHPDNSRLTVVSRRRRGLPILLSALWALVARGAGIHAEGVGMPGHFILRVGEGAGTLIDPFNRGAALSPSQCQRIVGKLLGGKVQWDDAFLEATGWVEWVERVLRNLVNSHHRAGATLALYRTTRFLATLRPEQPDALLLHGRIAEEVGALSEAVATYNDAADRFAGSVHGEQAAQRRAEVATRRQHLH
ncbi:MAG: transglutaminase family protein [Bradymonadia bacterium]